MLNHDRSCGWVLSIDKSVIGRIVWTNGTEVLDVADYNTVERVLLITLLNEP